MSHYRIMDVLPAMFGYLTIVVCSFCVLFVLWMRKVQSKQPKSLPLPPYSSASMIENMTAPGKQKTLFQLERYRRLCNDVGPADVGRTPYGSVFRSRVPFLNHFIVVSDHVLARLILAGNSSEGVDESEKSVLAKVVNFLDRKQHNLLSHKTANEERDAARKTIAHSFSTTNLNRTWPHVQRVIQEQFTAFRALSKSGEAVDCKLTITLFVMRTLSRGAFGIEFTSDGTEGEDNINGLEYLDAVDIAARESSREILNPFRTYMSWDAEVIRNKQAVQTLRNITEKLMRLHRANQARLEANGVQTRPFSILDHVAHHAYTNEFSRLADLSIIAFAGIDTTAYTLCFFLMEMSRHPVIKAKLQAELATFMPARGAAPPSRTSEKELLSAIANCEYLTWCFKEVLRLWPVVAQGVSRDLIHDIEYNGMLLPKGSMVMLPNYSMFRERWIDQPDVYLPERWSASNPQLPQLKEMLMPFSLGKRACIGQNMAMFQLRIVAAHFLHYFDFELAAEPSFEHFLTLKPDQLLMRVYERS